MAARVRRDASPGGTVTDRGWLARLVPNPWARVGLAVPIGLVVLVVVVMFRTMLFEPFRIPSGSNAPTIVIGDHVIVQKFRYGLMLPGSAGPVVTWDAPKRGDIVVFRYPKDPTVTYVKRVVAIGGDRIAVHDDHLTLNGVDLLTVPATPGEFTDDRCSHEPKNGHIETLDGVRHVIWTNAGTLGFMADMAEVVVPVGSVFLIGDNRDNSEDSRRWGSLPIDQVLGKVTNVWLSIDDCTGSVRTERFMRSVYAEPL